MTGRDRAGQAARTQEVAGRGRGVLHRCAGTDSFGGLDSTNPLEFKVWQPDRLVLGKRMVDHLRPGVCFWHSFAWPGVDMFGVGTLDRPWLDADADPMDAARTKMAVAFEFFEKLGTPYYCFHDRDVAPETGGFADFRANLDALVDDAEGYQERTGVRLLWGTANLFSHPRYQPARDQPRPEASPTPRRGSLCSRHEAPGGETTAWGGREATTRAQHRPRPRGANPVPPVEAQAQDRSRAL
jgi:xylose isomerase